jgi:hypothetical protein
MPAKSKAQMRFMEAAAHNPKFAKKAGIKPGIASEYVSSNKGNKSYSNLPEKVERFKKLKHKLKGNK